jgi:DNA-binding response OmpR family regulator
MSIPNQTFDRFRIAFIELEPAQGRHLGQLLEFEGFDVASFGRASLSHLPVHGTHLVVLNHSSLRDKTVSIARTLNPDPQHGPLTLALVAQSDQHVGVELVERGLDAYMVYPCGPREFVAWVRAMLRRVRLVDNRRLDRAAGDLPNSAVRVSSLEIDPLRRRVQLQGQNLRLTEQEFQLLYFLAGHPGRVFDRQALLDAVWGNDTFVTTRSVDALVKRLRHQLRTADQGNTCVETVRGVGYRLTDRQPVAAAPAG